MYNSSIKNQGTKQRFAKHLEVPHKIFFNDMSKNYMCEDFKTCDCVYSGIAWQYGYKIFNQNAGNIPDTFSSYCQNINRLIEELNVPAFITGGKQHIKYFPKAVMHNIDLNNCGTNMPNVRIFIWNYDGYDSNTKSTTELINKLCNEFKKPLDFSCGYGEHLMKFEDFVACDIDRDCLTYLSILWQERERGRGKAKN